MPRPPRTDDAVCMHCCCCTLCDGVAGQQGRALRRWAGAGRRDREVARGRFHGVTFTACYLLPFGSLLAGKCVWCTMYCSKNQNAKTETAKIADDSKLDARFPNVVPLAAPEGCLHCAKAAPSTASLLMRLLCNPMGAAALSGSLQLLSSCLTKRVCMCRRVGGVRCVYEALREAAVWEEMLL